MRLPVEGDGDNKAGLESYGQGGGLSKAGIGHNQVDESLQLRILLQSLSDRDPGPAAAPGGQYHS